MVEGRLDDCNARIELWPSELRAGDRILVAIRTNRMVGAAAERCEVTIVDAHHRRVVKLPRGSSRPSRGVIFLEWDGRDDRGRQVPVGSYRILVHATGTRLRLERTVQVS